MKKIFHLLLMLFVFQSVAYAAYSWDFRSVQSQIAGTESFLDTTKYVTTEPHSGTVTVTLTAMGPYSTEHRVRYSTNGGASWVYLNHVDDEAIIGAGNIVVGWDFDYIIETVAGNYYTVQVINLLTNIREDWLIIYAKEPVPNVLVMEEGDERGEWPATETVRAYCPAGSQIISGYCKIWDDTEVSLDESPDQGTMNSNYYECRNPYSIGEDRYTRAYAECYQ